MVLQILTANRLSDGCVVWYAGAHGWVEDSARAVMARDKDEKDLLAAQAQAAMAANLVVETALIDVEEGEEAFYALRLRERIRQQGPSIAYGLSARHYEDTRQPEGASRNFAPPHARSAPVERQKEEETNVSL